MSGEFMTCPGYVGGRKGLGMSWSQQSYGLGCDARSISTRLSALRGQNAPGTTLARQEKLALTRAHFQSSKPTGVHLDIIELKLYPAPTTHTSTSKSAPGSE